MRNYQQYVEFANFVCHFGNSPMLDYLEEIVIPAFTEGKRIRMYGRSQYLLIDTTLTKVVSADGVSTPAITGKFVLNTNIHRDQILVDGKILASTMEMPSAPSSLFVLELSTHKLMYTKEVSGAPGLSAFRTTIESFLKMQRNNYIDKILKENKEKIEQGKSIKRITKKSLSEAIPTPNLEIVELPGNKNLEKFIEKFKKLKEFSIKVVKPNQDVNNSGLFNSVENAREEVDAESTTVIHRNPNGLNKNKSIDQIKPALDGNAHIKLSGIANDDKILRGSNDELSVKEPIDVKTPSKSNFSKMYQAFLRVLSLGLLKTNDVKNSNENQLKLQKMELEIE